MLPSGQQQGSPSQPLPPLGSVMKAPALAPLNKTSYTTQYMGSYGAAVTSFPVQSMSPSMYDATSIAPQPVYIQPGIPPLRSHLITSVPQQLLPGPLPPLQTTVIPSLSLQLFQVPQPSQLLMPSPSLSPQPQPQPQPQPLLLPQPPLTSLLPPQQQSPLPAEQPMQQPIQFALARGMPAPEQMQTVTGSGRFEDVVPEMTRSMLLERQEMDDALIAPQSVGAAQRDLRLTQLLSQLESSSPVQALQRQPRHDTQQRQWYDQQQQQSHQYPEQPQSLAQAHGDFPSRASPINSTQSFASSESLPDWAIGRRRR